MSRPSRRSRPSAGSRTNSPRASGALSGEGGAGISANVRRAVVRFPGVVAMVYHLRREPRDLGPAAPACQGRWYLPTLVLLAPVSVPLVPLESVPDPVVAVKPGRAGIAIDPVSSTLLAPCDAEVTSVHPSGHAVTLRAAGGVGSTFFLAVATVSA